LCIYYIIYNNPNRHGNNKNLNVVAPTVTYGIKIMHDVLVLEFLTMLLQSMVLAKNICDHPVLPPSLGTVPSCTMSNRINCTKSQLISEKILLPRNHLFQGPKASDVFSTGILPGATGCLGRIGWRCSAVGSLLVARKTRRKTVDVKENQEEINANLESEAPTFFAPGPKGLTILAISLLKVYTMHKPSLIIIDHH